MSLLASPALAAGPFGLEPGTKLKQLQALCELVPTGDDSYFTKNPPMPDAAFGVYALKVSPTYGLVQVTAYRRHIATSRDGKALKNALHEVEKALATKYGKGRLFDHAQSGYTLDEHDWTVDLSRQRRVYAYTWSKAEGSDLPASIKEISAVVTASEQTEGTVMLMYVFADSDKAKAESDAAPRVQAQGLWQRLRRQGAATRRWDAPWGVSGVQTAASTQPAWAASAARRRWRIGSTSRSYQVRICSSGRKRLKNMAVA